MKSGITYSQRYACRGAFSERAEMRCISFGSMRVDRAIAREVLDRVQPLGIEAALSTVKSFGQEQSCCLSPGKQMLETDLVPPRHLGNNRSREIRLRDGPAFLFLAPATPAANTSPDFYSATWPRSVKYIVDHICEPIPPDRSTSADLSMSPQGAVKRSLTAQQLNIARFGELGVAGIAVDLQDSLEALEMDERPRLCGQVHRHRRRPADQRAPWSVVRGTGPKPASLGAPVAGIEHWHRLSSANSLTVASA
jgi:hypothetical protein